MSRIAYFFALFTIALTGCTADTSTPPDVRVEGAWSRPTLFADQADPEAVNQVPAGTGVVYLTLTNLGGSEDALISAESAVSGQILLHQTRVEGDMASMHEMDGIIIPASQRVELAPNGSHLMLTSLTRQLVEGQSFEVTLRFKSGKVLSIPVAIESR